MDLETNFIRNSSRINNLQYVRGQRSTSLVINLCSQTIGLDKASGLILNMIYICDADTLKHTRDVMFCVEARIGLIFWFTTLFLLKFKLYTHLLLYLFIHKLYSRH